MIRIKITNNRIGVEGHACYAPPGQDIVCAGISALFQTLVASVSQLTDRSEAQWFYQLGPGNSYIEYENGDEKQELLIRSFILGVGMIAEAYPQYVEVIDQECKS